MFDVTIFGNAFAWRASNVLNTRPAAALGATVTPGNNAKGSYAAVLTSGDMARDAFGLLININSNAVSAAGRDAIVDIGIDPAGGSSYTVKIPDLLGSCASPYNVGQGGCWYYFPLWIRAGSSVGARASVNNATVGTLRVTATAYGSPRNRKAIRVGTYVEAVGITAASSRGTTVTSGTTAEGAWTSLGTIARDSWWWQLGMGVNDTTMSALAYHADLAVGDASNKTNIIENALVTTTAAEQLGIAPQYVDCQKVAPAGSTVYGRLQCSGTADSALSLAGYALGG